MLSEKWASRSESFAVEAPLPDQYRRDL